MKGPRTKSASAGRSSARPRQNMGLREPPNPGGPRGTSGFGGFWRFGVLRGLRGFGDRGRGRSSRNRHSGALHDDGYFRLSTRPLYVLAFLFPLIVLYEIGSAFHVISGASGVEETIRARRILSDFFRLFDVGGLYLPGILVIVVLLLWHVLTRDPWRLKTRVLGWMAVEALFWTPPVLVLGQVLYRVLSGTPGAQAPTASGLLASLAAASSGADPAALADRSLLSRLAIAIGAGLYEEMLFRMVAIAALHAILVDLMGLSSRRGTMLAVALAAAAFAFYHDVHTRSGAIDWANAGFYIFAGLYFGVVYVLRGFGIVVAVHALYDLAVLVFLKR